MITVNVFFVLHYGQFKEQERSIKGREKLWKKAEEDRTRGRVTEVEARGRTLVGYVGSYI